MYPNMKMSLKIAFCCTIFSLAGYSAYNEPGAGSNKSKEAADTYKTSADEGKIANNESAAASEQKRFPYISGNVSFITNYSYRGVSETLNKPAVQGEFIISQKPNVEGFYAGMWGSNVDGITAPNGNSLELIPYVGHVYRVNPDLSLKFEIRGTIYPGCYTFIDEAQTIKEKFDMLEFIPGFTYKWFTFYVAVQSTNVTGLTPNLIQELFTPPPPNGNTKWSYYSYGQLLIPVPHSNDQLKLKLWAGYWKIRHYSMLSYGHFGGGLNYTLPKSYMELTLSANVEGTTAKQKYWTNVDEAGKQTNLVGTKVWLGIYKEF